MSLHRLLYRSQPAVDRLPDDIDAELLSIVLRSQAKNAAVGLTGALMYASGVFIQALEGPLASVEATFERICCDQRHRHVRLIEFAPAEARMFEQWSMASIAPDRQLVRLCASLAAIEGARTDTIGVAATVQLMRTLLLSGPSLPDGQRMRAC